MTVNEARYILTVPRFQRAEAVANAVLADLGYPEPPIDLLRVADLLDCRVRYDTLRGPEGYTLRHHAQYFICVATDVDGYSPEVIRRKQNWTLGHELGHVLLHWDIPWNSTLDLERIPAELESVLEVEAHWCASRLLMPDYVFQSLDDVIPELLADKCGVNIAAATKRLKNLSWIVRERLQALTDLPLERVPAYFDFVGELPEKIWR
ncbi:MAG: ImmA/IrrE family metallo-endopeptidase [Alicyclobacillaceae bacterium]|nr:ImmA/IrrE family metallo-endopeptidase [Alicyclobacillaceae bacterium]